MRKGPLKGLQQLYLSMDAFAYVSLFVLAVTGCSFRCHSDAAPIFPQGRSGTDTLGASFNCELCKVVSSVLELYLEEGSTEEEIEEVIGQICILLEIQDENVCNSAMREFKGEVLTVAYYITLGRAKLACSILVGSTCATPYDPWNQTWTVNIPGNKPSVLPIPDPKPGSPITGILHISDIHWDQNYTAGLSNDCGEPICCRPPNKPGNGSSAAGPWGDYNCDLPNATLISLMEYLKTIQDQFDLVYVTGDLPAHNVWNQSRHDQLFILNTITSLFKQYFPAKMVYFTFGNHEGVPVNSFPPPSIDGPIGGPGDLQWLLDDATNVWSTWLDENSTRTLKYGGYYNQFVYDGLRVISLQTNFGNHQNYWLLINDTDPAGQLEWLIQQLVAAESAGDKVHIIGHITPGQFTPSFGRAYHDIVNRFESTIAGQFFGHTHKDEFQVFFDDTNKTRATNVALIGPSITTDHDNAGFRIYSVDGDYSGSSHAVLDYTAIYMNVTDANLKNKPTWQKEYIAKAAFGMTTLHPADWADLVDRFHQDDALFQQYYKYKYKLRPPHDTCDASCKASTLCELVTTVTGDTSACTKYLTDGVTMDDVWQEMSGKRGSC